jgi:hypothetical protein
LVKVPAHSNGNSSRSRILGSGGRLILDHDRENRNRLGETAQQPRTERDQRESVADFRRGCGIDQDLPILGRRTNP